MNGHGDTQPIDITSTFQGDGGMMSAARLADAVKKRWRCGEQPNVAAVLTAHPDLHRYRSVVLDLACHEYQHRLAQGESLEAEDFARRFPSLQKSLYMLLEVQRLLDEDPQFRIAPESAPWPELGDDFLGFCLLAELGRGTFGRVFLASEPSLGNRLVALKVAPHGGDEAEIIAKLRHSNIVPIYSIQEAPETGLTAVCMPYLGRTTLCDVLDRAFADHSPPARASVILETIQDLGEASDLQETHLTDPILSCGTYVDGVIHLGVQLANALAYTHGRGVCHRDLKPSNVLLTLDGRPLLLDFNLSYDQQQTAKRVGGTLPYMAPEQLQQLLPETPREPAQADPRSDLFSLGVILYELLSGRHPFGSISWNRPLEQVAASLFEQHRQGPQPLKPLNRQINKSLARLIRQCLAFEPADRPQSAADLAVALRRQLSPLPRARRWIQDHPIRSACAGTLLAVSLVALMTVVAMRDPASIRQFRQGDAYFRQEQYSLALDAYREALRLAPGLTQAQFARARTYQKLGLYEPAMQDLRVLEQHDTTGRVQAQMGYCLLKRGLGTSPAATDYFRQAIEMGFRTPAVLNNLGFVHRVCGRFQQSETCYKEALEIDPHLREAHFGLVILYYNWRGASNHKPIPKEAAYHAKMAAELGPPSNQVYLLCAQLLIREKEVDKSQPLPESQRRRALEYLRQAILHGVAPAELTRIAFGPLSDDPEFKLLLNMPVGHEPSQFLSGMADPLESLLR
jgi:tetratricopeptide (TPR) repeat protein